MSDPLTTATDLAGRLDPLFARGRELCPWPAGRQVRELAACGTTFRCFYLPWRRNRRGLKGTPPPVSSDAGERIITREALWRKDGLAVTPNLYPFAPSHLLLWEGEPRREPGAALLEVLYRVCAARPDLLGMVNTIGSAATVTRAHAQVAAVPEAEALAGVETAWEAGGGLEFGFPSPTGAWPALFVALRGEPARVAATLERLLRLRRTPAFNILVAGDRAWYLPRTQETCSLAYTLPLGALELAGVFGFEDQPAYQAMTGELVARALGGTCWAPTSEAAAAFREQLAP